MATPEEAIEVIHGTFGSHAGSRALHAKGAFFAGTFTATPVAATLTRAAHMQGTPVQVWVRWSDGSGHPKAHDGKPDVRGMAVSFRLPDGSATDILGQTAPRFPVRNPDEFLALLRASAPGPGLAVRLPLFLASHPHAVAPLLANLRAGSLKPPHSFAEATYYAIHAYRWLDASGGSRWVRYTLAPLASHSPGPRGRGADYLFTEINSRLARAPVRFQLQVQIAEGVDRVDDPSSTWSSRERLDVGTIEVTGPDPDRETAGKVVVFDPVRVTDGIELSDDPVLRFRPLAYSASVNNRV